MSRYLPVERVSHVVGEVAPVFMQVVQFLPEGGTQLKEFVDQQLNSDIAAEGNRLERISFDHGLASAESAINFASALGQFADWSRSVDRIEQMKKAVHDDNFEEYKFFMATLKTHVPQVTKCRDSSRKRAAQGKYKRTIQRKK